MSGSKQFLYELISLEQLSEELFIAKFNPDKESLIYQAGQYIAVQYPDGNFQPFSIANAPQINGMLELHIRCLQDDERTQAFIRQLIKQKTLTLQGPFGGCCFPLAPNHPLILLATGVGFAQCKSYIEQAIKQNSLQEIHLFWGNRNQQDFYLLELLNQWQKKVTNFQYTLVLSRSLVDDKWPGEQGYVQDIMLKLYPQLEKFAVLAAGSPMMIKHAFEACLTHGLSAKHFFSDIPPQ